MAEDDAKVIKNYILLNKLLNFLFGSFPPTSEVHTVVVLVLVMVGN
jgi:hypothetical protein